mmetsp:Transcript_14287/g.19885  ORF Transcript_14287/g.19885 Transcript_14287/m.19885 type:complete len:137 (+) Transcript_14287:1253-1663(+)
MNQPDIKGRLVFITCGKYEGKYGFVIKSFSKNNNFRNFEHSLIGILSNLRFSSNKTHQLNRKKFLRKLKYKLKFKVLNISHLILTSSVVPESWVNDDSVTLVINSITSQYVKNKFSSWLGKQIDLLNKDSLIKLFK